MPMLEKALETSDGLRTLIDDLLRELSELAGADGKPFNIAAPIPGTNETPVFLQARLHAVLELARSLVPVIESPLLTQISCDSVANYLTEANSHVQGTIGLIQQLKSKKLTFNYSNYTITVTAAPRPQSHQLANNFKNISASIDKLTESILPLLAVSKEAGSFDFSSAVSALSEKTSFSIKQLEEIKKKHNEIKLEWDGIKSNSEKIVSLTSKVEQSSQKIFDAESNATGMISNISEFQVKAESVASDALKLQSAVNAFKEKFIEFDAALDERESRLEAGNSDLSELTKKFKDQAAIVENLIDRSEEMLSSSTVAGLAAHFEKIRVDLTNEMATAQTSFKWGMWLLALSSLPLVALVLSPFISIFIPSWSTTAGLAEQSGWQYMAQAVSRIVILLPAAWFVSFMGFRYSSLFRLREHYSYKYSMAVSVEGFKKQAPGYEEEIAALVFEQILFNPADKITANKSEKESDPPGLLGYLLEKIRKRTEKSLDGGGSK